LFYVLHGSDEFTIAETVAGLRARLAESDPMAELNSSELDGKGLTVAELQATADALPFLGERRLVVVHGLLARCNPRGGDGARSELAEGLKGYLPRLPPSTRLLLVDGPLAKNNPLLRWVEKWRAEQPVPDEAAVVRAFETPPASALPRWLAARAKSRGGVIEPAAAADLAAALDRDGEVDLRLSDMELEKLLTYAGERAVTAADVAALVTPVGLESVFRLVDALAGRDGPAAATLLHQFLDAGEHPLRLLALVVRQFRLLVLARALLDEGVAPNALRERLGVAPFVATKVAGQARRFTLPALEGCLRQLLEIDTAIKTGRTEATLALDLFVAGVCGPVPATRQPLRR
jgi:DNA polymerase-3 subunit delta